MKHFNKLTPSEEERLSILLEEMGESIRIIGKIQRHGYEMKDPTDRRPPNHVPTNRQSLEEELGHVRHAMILLCESGDLNKHRIHESAEEKKESIKPWFRHQ